MSLPVKAQTVVPLANTTVGNARLIVPDGSSLRQSIGSGETRWFVFGAEPGKTYVVEAVDPDSDLGSNTIGALHVYAANGTTTPPAETNVDCTASTRAPAMELPVAVSGMRCVVRAFPPSPGNTQNKRGLYVAVGSVTGPSFDIRVRESTIYGRWTTNGYDFHVELENTSADSMCAEVMLLPNAGDSTRGRGAGAVTTQQLTIPAFGANKLVFANGTLGGADNRGTLRIGACSSPVNFDAERVAREHLRLQPGDRQVPLLLHQRREQRCHGEQLVGGERRQRCQRLRAGRQCVRDDSQARHDRHPAAGASCRQCEGATHRTTR